ncbi:MAG: dTDP-4-dehydrorhamnose 3,5-epimerase family protein [Tepidisphaeraceae bacterium]
MVLTPTILRGCYVIEHDPRADDRGFFARTWDREALLAKGLDAGIALIATTYNKQAGTLRGMHLQVEPFAETKFVRVTRGSIFDVAVDLRSGSPTYLKWHGELLSADNRRQLYIPKGCARLSHARRRQRTQLRAECAAQPGMREGLSLRRSEVQHRLAGRSEGHSLA